jgi:hypothetical protein
VVREERGKGGQEDEEGDGACPSRTKVWDAAKTGMFKHRTSGNGEPGDGERGSPGTESKGHKSSVARELTAVPTKKKKKPPRTSALGRGDPTAPYKEGRKWVQQDGGGEIFGGDEGRSGG